MYSCSALTAAGGGKLTRSRGAGLAKYRGIEGGRGGKMAKTVAGKVKGKIQRARGTDGGRETGRRKGNQAKQATNLGYRE